MLVYIVYVEYYTLSLFQDRVRDNLLANGRKYNGHVHVMYMKVADSCLKSQLTDASMHLHVFHFTCKMQIGRSCEWHFVCIQLNTVHLISPSTFLLQYNYLRDQVW